MKMTLWDKIKIGFAALTKGTDGLISALLTKFNNSVLKKIKNPDEAKLYSQDIRDFCFFMRTVFNRHQNWMRSSSKAVWISVFDSLDVLASALEDCDLTQEEFDTFRAAVRTAIANWKAASSDK